MFVNAKIIVYPRDMKLTTEGKRFTEWQIQEADVQCQRPGEGHLPLLREQSLDQTEMLMHVMFIQVRLQLCDNHLLST